MFKAETAEYLASCGVRPSPQRVAVMEYLMTHHTHPTVDTIYAALSGSMPTLSRTTVYNTLKLLVEHKAVRQLTIDERNSCFDGDMSPHAHFLCTRCGRVYDITLHKPYPELSACVPTGFRVEQTELYLRGCCENCAKNEEHDTEE